MKKMLHNRQTIAQLRRIAKQTCVSAIRRFLQHYKNLSIRLKLLVVLNVILLVPLIIIGYISYRSSEEVIQNNSIQYSQDVLKFIELRLNDNIHNLDTISQNAMADDRIYNPISRSAKNAMLSYEDNQEMGAYLRNIIMNSSEIQCVGILSNADDYVTADNNKSKTSIKSIIPPGGKELDAIRKTAQAGGGKPIWYIMSQGKTLHLLYARTIYDSYTYKEIGLMIILINADYMSSVFESVENRDMQNVAVIADMSGTNQSTVILSKLKSRMRSLSQSDFDKMGGDGWFIDNSKNLLAVYTQMSDPKWKIVSYVPLDVLYHDIQGLRNKILFSCLITVIVISLVSFYMAYDFITPINKLISGMKKVQQGDENVSIELNRKDEIGYLGDTFNGMVSEISMLEKWVYREQLTRKDAQIKSLQSQINPHFLFNTLESINWMAQLENAPKISDTVTALASLMEANISRDDKFISLKKEIDYIDDYMLIMKNRFEDRLELVREIDPGCLDIEIPRLLIQPVVENAVYHGVGNIRGKGVIKLSTKIDESVLTITVEDNGAGIDPQKVEALNRSLAMNDEAYFNNLEKKHSGGIGLENVNRRIKLFYGSDYGIAIDSQMGAFTRVYIRIPVS